MVFKVWKTATAPWKKKKKTLYTKKMVGSILSMEINNSKWCIEKGTLPLLRKNSFLEKVAVQEVTLARRNDYNTLLRNDYSLTKGITATSVVKLTMNCCDCSDQFTTFTTKKWMVASAFVHLTQYYWNKN